MVTHSAQAASHASRVLFIKDGEVFHQIYKGSKSRQEMYQMIADTLRYLRQAVRAMRRGLFGKLAVQNIRNNRSTYIPYMITCIFCIAMMYMMEFFRTVRHWRKQCPRHQKCG